MQTSAAVEHLFQKFLVSFHILLHLLAELRLLRAQGSETLNRLLSLVTWLPKSQTRNLQNGSQAA